MTAQILSILWFLCYLRHWILRYFSYTFTSSSAPCAVCRGCTVTVLTVTVHPRHPRQVKLPTASSPCVNLSIYCLVILWIVHYSYCQVTANINQYWPFYSVLNNTDSFAILKQHLSCESILNNTEHNLYWPLGYYLKRPWPCVYILSDIEWQTFCFF